MIPSTELYKCTRIGTSYQCPLTAKPRKLDNCSKQLLEAMQEGKAQHNSCKNHLKLITKALQQQEYIYKKGGIILFSPFKDKCLIQCGMDLTRKAITIGIQTILILPGCKAETSQLIIPRHLEYTAQRIIF